MNNTQLYIGVDVGGTSTRAALVTPAGRCLGLGTAHGGNPTSRGRTAAIDGVAGAVGAAAAPSGRRLTEVAGIVVAMAGHDLRTSAEWLRPALRALGFDGSLTAESDLLAAYFSGETEPNGYAMVSGTGAAAIRVAEGALAASADGLGWLLGDAGSGFWIGHRVVRAALADLDGRGESTALTALLLADLGIPSREGAVGDALQRLYAERPVALARFAPLAFEVADDAVATRILTGAGERLAETLRAVHRRPGPLVTAGSVLTRPSPVADAVTAAARTLDPGVRISTAADGTVGAAVLALRHGGHRPGRDTAAALHADIARLR